MWLYPVVLLLYQDHCFKFLELHVIKWIKFEQYTRQDIQFVVAMLCILFRTDTRNELELVQKKAKESGAFDAIICNHWALGGSGAAGLAEAVEKAMEQPTNFKFLYDLNVRNSLE